MPFRKIVTNSTMSRPRNFKRWFLPVAVVLLVGLGGCRNVAGLFLPVNYHEEVVSESKAAVLAGSEQLLGRALDRLERQSGTRSALLYLLEAGRLLELAGKTEEARRVLAEADAFLEAERMRATFTVRGGAAQIASLATNDQALPYRGHLYERVMLSTYQALNELGSGDVEAARIALNKGLRDMRWGSENLEALSRQESARLEQQGIGTAGLPPLLDPAYPAANPRHSSDNAFVYYLSGLLHEVRGDRDRAAIDYRNALAFNPGSVPLQHALEALDGVEKGTGRVVLIHESDWVSPKIPFSFSIFVRDRSYTWSLPSYADMPYYAIYPESFLRLGSERPLLHPVLNLEAVVRRAHEEAMPGILLRQALRVAAKQELQAEAEEADPFLGFAASIYSILSDGPDLRSWQSLPSVIYLADLTMPAGTYPLSTDFDGQPVLDLFVDPEAITVVRMVTAQGALIKVESFSLPLYK